jgi:hypothetical protein
MFIFDKYICYQEKNNNLIVTKIEQIQCIKLIRILAIHVYLKFTQKQ